MINLYDYHNQPDTLSAYKDRTKLIPELAFEYAFNTDKRWPAGEPAIMKSPQFACEYANCVIGDRWPEAEPYIMKDPHYAYAYACYVIKDRWPEAEPDIIKNPIVAYRYAKYILKHRWEEAEPSIKQNKNAWNEYKYHFFGSI